MTFKVGILCLAIFVGSFALPAVQRDSLSSRIVGGKIAGDVPHMVALSYGVIVRSFFCGGSLVSPRHVLTAAHCLVPVVTGESVNLSLRGTVGSNRLSSGGIQIAFLRGIIHENYMPAPIVKNDIGVLVSSASVPLNNAINVVALNFDWIEGGVASTVYGWGRTSFEGPISDALMELNPTVLDGEQCVEEAARRAVELNWTSIIPPVDPTLEICTFHSAEQGICQGDSGGALLKSETKDQIGVVSWVFPCARNAPDIYVRISSYKTWLQEKLA